jgi:hypothetical protein
VLAVYIEFSKKILERWMHLRLKFSLEEIMVGQNKGGRTALTENQKLMHNFFIIISAALREENKTSWQFLSAEDGTKLPWSDF